MRVMHGFLHVPFALAALAVSTPLVAQEVLVISGDGFSPPTLSVGQKVSGKVTADSETILVIEERKGSCTAWTILRGRSWNAKSSLSADCATEGNGDELARAMSGENLVGRVVWFDPGKADCAGCNLEASDRVHDDLGRLKERSPSPPTQTPGGTTALAPRPRAGAERECHKRLQNRIAWDYQGNKRWNVDNLERLCRGTSRPGEPAQCFRQAMHGGIDWGGGTRWQWANAIDLCEGTNDAAGTIRCFQTMIERGKPWKLAIQECTERECHGRVQNRIAWNDQGNKRWNTGNLERLCRGTSRAGEPAKCFRQVMHGGIDWGGGTRWQWGNAVDLCEGTNDAAGTVRCFQTEIRRGKTWERAIQQCGTR